MTSQLTRQPVRSVASPGCPERLLRWVHARRVRPAAQCCLHSSAGARRQPASRARARCRRCGAVRCWCWPGPARARPRRLVELVVDRVERGLPPDEALVLTFSRKAAQQLRSRIARRLPGAGVVPVMTFHSYCYALVRAASPPEQFADPLRLLSAPEQEWRMAEVLLGASEMGRVTWPTELQPALRTRGFARELVDFVGRARSYDLDPDALRVLADERERARLAQHRRPVDGVRAGAGPRSRDRLLRSRRRGEPDHAGHPAAARRGRRVPGHRSGPGRVCSRASSGRAPISSPSATPTSPSTPSVALTSEASGRSPTGSARPPGRPPRSRCAGRAGSGRRCWRRRER